MDRRDRPKSMCLYTNTAVLVGLDVTRGWLASRRRAVAAQAVASRRAAFAPAIAGIDWAAFLSIIV